MFESARVPTANAPEFFTDVSDRGIRHSGERVGTFFLTEKEGGRAFTPDDEKTLVMFASFSALAITNVRRYRDEQRAKVDLDALIKTSPVSVTVFNART